MNNNIVILLSKSKNQYSEHIKNNILDSIVIYDTDYKDSDVINNGFYNLTGSIKNPSAWDKAFYYISQHLLTTEFKYIWFLEDDVFTTDINTIIKLLGYFGDSSVDLISHDIKHKTATESWCFWKKHNIENMLHNSYNPICRISKTLISSILDYRKQHNSFLFHEILFASLAMNNGMNTLDLNLSEAKDKFFGVFQYRPIINIDSIQDNKIYHPVKPEYL